MCGYVHNLKVTCEIDLFQGLKYLPVWFRDFDKVVCKNVPDWLFPVPSYRCAQVLCVFEVVLDERG